MYDTRLVKLKKKILIIKNFNKIKEKLIHKTFSQKLKL
jgi:hypothetical protein